MSHPQAKNAVRGPIRKPLTNRPSGNATTAVARHPVHQAVQSTLMALEPRMLFDGAGLATAADVIERQAEARQPDSTDALRDNAIAFEPSSAASVTSLLVVDQSVQGWQQLIDGRADGTDVLVLDPNQDGLAQIAGAVAKYSNLASIQIVSHGDQGVISLGNRLVNENALNQSAGVLSTIGGALSKDGDILLFGCEVGSGAKGAAFLQALARSTQADVAASTDLTGAARLGGDWNLEAQSGVVESASVLSAVSTAGYASLLDTLAVNNGSDGGRIYGHLWDDTLDFDNVIDATPLENCFADRNVKLIWAGADGVFGTVVGDAASLDDIVYQVQTGNGGATPAEADGIFEFTGLAAGNYRVMVEQTFTDSISRNVKVVGDVNDASGTAGSDGMATITLGFGQARTDLNFRYLQINDAPTVVVPGLQNVFEDTPFVFSGPLAISIGDSPLDMVTAVTTFAGYFTTLTVDHGTLSLTPQAGVTITGQDSNTITLEGTIADINAALTSLTYLSDLNYVGTDTLRVNVNDRGNLGDAAADGNCAPGDIADHLFATAQIDICVNNVNELPIAVTDANQTFSTSTTAVVGNVIGGPGATAGDQADSDPDGDVPLTICGVARGNPAGTPNANVGTPIDGMFGTLTLDLDGGYSYLVNTSNPTIAALAGGDTRVDTFTYCVQDSMGNPAKAQLNITITGNGRPAPLPDTNSTVEGSLTPATGNVLGGAGKAPTDQTDSDPNGDGLAVCGVVAGNVAGAPIGNVGSDIRGTFGTVRIDANGTYSYQVDNTNATVIALNPTSAPLIDVFTYCVTDGKGGVDKTTLTITITGINSAPAANPDTNSTVVGSPTPVTGNVLGGIGKAPTDATDTDPEGDLLVVCGVAAGTPGAVPSGFVGSAVPGTYGSVTIAANGSYTYVVDAADPVVAGLAPGVSLIDVFTYCATDNNGESVSTTLTITITAPPNLPPVAVPDTNVTTADATTPSTGNVLGGPGKAPTDATDTDPTNDPLTVCGVVAGITTGTPAGNVGSALPGLFGALTLNADGRYSYQVSAAEPLVLALKPGETLADVFTYCLSDGKGGFDKTTLTITITGVNDCPVAVSDGNNVNASNGATTTGNAVGSVGAGLNDRADIDPDRDNLTVCGVAAGSPAATNVSGNVGTAVMGQYGSLTVNSNGTYSYVVDASKPGVVALRPGQTLTDTFTYCVTDGVCAPQKAQIVITLDGINDPPVATGRPDMTDEGGAIRCDLAAVSDAEDAPAALSVTIDSIANSPSGTFFIRQPVAGQPGQFTETPVTAGMTLTGEQIANLCFRANSQPNAPRGTDGALLPPTLNYTVTDTNGARASSSTTITIKPPQRVEPPVVPPTLIPPVVLLPPDLVPPNFIPPTDTRSLPPILIPPLSLAPALDPVSLWDPATSLAEAPPTDKAVKSAVATNDAPKTEVDCIPTAKPKIKVKAVKRAVYTAEALKPAKAFSEQIGEAKKRFKLPAKLAPKAPSLKEC